MNNTKLINAVNNEYAWKEPVHEDFVSREDFINRTGVFISPFAYDYIYDIEFKESGLTPDEFIDKYEIEHYGEIGELELNGTFKYLVTDEELSCIGEYEDCHDPSIYEIVNSLSRNFTESDQKRYEQVTKAVDLCQRMKNEYERVLSQLQDLQTDIFEKILEIGMWRKNKFIRRNT